MLDTKLKKTRRLSCLVIALIVIIPAFILVALYPQMEKAALDKIEMYEKQYEEVLKQYEEAEYQWELQPGFVHMATESSFYMYSLFLEESIDAYIDKGVLSEYGWINDYNWIIDTTHYYAQYNSSGETQETTNVSWDMSELLTLSDAEIWNELEEKDPGRAGFLMLSFDEKGNIKDVRVSMRDWIKMENSYYDLVDGSIAQYKENVRYWKEMTGSDMSTEELIPKNFQAIFVLNDISSFGFNMFPDYYQSNIDNYPLMYYETGALIPVFLGVLFVAFAALILPFVKKLHTGWEKLFSLPFEIIVGLIIAGFGGACGMFILMSHSSMTVIKDLAMNQETVMHIIGIGINHDAFYKALIVLNFVGWALCFFAEYIVISSFRQFLSGPVYYLKNRVLLIRFSGWLKNRCKHFIRSLLCVELNKQIHRSMILFILVNTGICVFIAVLFIVEFVFGVAACFVYVVLLYILFKKYAIQIKTWYQGLLNATKQMAQGNLKVNMEEDYGAFQELSVELKNVQAGFSKAVALEARSQNMKTELITNVSHDLKTPLTAIVTYVDLLKQEDLTDEERKKYVGILDQKSQRLKVLIEDLFEVSKAASGNIQMNFMDVDVVSLMKEVRLEMEEKILDSELYFKWNLPEEKIILPLDGQKTFRIFENLLNNILKYSLSHSRVYVDIINEKSQVRILFRNISAIELPDDVSRLTERFVRGDASRQTEGCGLGLAIVKSFVELQHGKLDISMDGDLFKVTILWNK